MRLAVLAALAFTAISIARSWSEPLTPFWWEPEPPNVGTGLALLDISRLNNGQTVLLAEKDRHSCLLVGADESGLGQLISLPIEGGGLRLAAGLGDTLWIGGSKNDRIAGISSGHFSDGYLAKLDQRGQVAWQHTYGGTSFRNILSMAPLPSGDIIVAGTDDDRTWLARISSSGDVVWERFVGRGGGSVLSTDGKIFLAAYEAGDNGRNRSYPQNLSIWIFSETGDLLVHRVIREAINAWAFASLGKLLIKQSDEAMYVFSEGNAAGTANPLQVAKVNKHWQVIWRTELPETAQNNQGQINFCAPNVTILANGDPLILNLCQPSLIRLNSLTGEAARLFWQLPEPPAECEGRWFPPSLLTQKANDVVWIFGSSSAWDPVLSRIGGIEGCIWAGRIAPPQ